MLSLVTQKITQNIKNQQPFGSSKCFKKKIITPVIFIKHAALTNGYTNRKDVCWWIETHKENIWTPLWILLEEHIHICLCEFCCKFTSCALACNLWLKHKNYRLNLFTSASWSSRTWVWLWFPSSDPCQVGTVLRNKDKYYLSNMIEERTGERN